MSRPAALEIIYKSQHKLYNCYLDCYLYESEVGHYETVIHKLTKLLHILHISITVRKFCPPSMLISTTPVSWWVPGTPGMENKTRLVG